MSWLIPEGAQVDWQAWAILIGGLANALAIGAAAYWAKENFEAWKNQHHYRRKSYLVEKALIAFEEAADALYDARNPNSFGEEIQKAKDMIPEYADNPDRWETALVIRNRIINNQKKWDNIVSLLAPCRVHFGMEQQMAMRSLLKCVREVYSAAEFYAKDSGSDKFQERMEAKMWRNSDFTEDGEETDKLNERVESARKQLYDSLNKYLN